MCHYTFDDEREKNEKKFRTSGLIENQLQTDGFVCLSLFGHLQFLANILTFSVKIKTTKKTRHTKKLCFQNHDGYAIGRLFVLVFYYNSIHSVSTLKRDRPPCICVVVEQPAEELEARFHRTHQLRISH